MSNSHTRAILEYHESTSHSPERIRADPHFLDWSIQPLPFKVYPHLPPILLPRQWKSSAVPALRAVATTAPPPAGEVVPDLTMLARLFYFSAGILRIKEHPGGGKRHFRAAACTGALYHIDLYLVCGELPGLEAGVYHFGPHDFALRRLRSGDYRTLLVEATAAEPAVASAPAVVVCTSTFWRNAWKYRARTYRHCFWDNGTILANFLAVAAADGVPVRVVMGFVDRVVNDLLGLDTRREVALSLLAVGHLPATTSAPAPPVPPLAHETLSLGEREVDYPAIRAAHEASCLASFEEVRAWRAARLSPVAATRDGRSVPLRRPAALPGETIDDVIRRRGSTRRFARRAISFEQLSTLLRHATRGIPADFLDGGSLNDFYLLVHAVDGLPSGAYVYDPASDDLELLRRGDFRDEARFLGLWQDLAGDASLDCYLLSDLGRVLGAFGNRGYRAAMLEAAIVGGKLYLAAYAQRFGATGLTFFDDDVTGFFSPHAAGKSVMFLLAAGRPRRA